MPPNAGDSGEMVWDVEKLASLLFDVNYLFE
jgi:hypothetical protein